MVLKTQVIAILSLLTIIISIIGLADSGYVTYEKFSGVIPACGAGFSCDTVLTSDYAYFGPIPISVFGFLFYGAMFILGIFHYLDLPLITTDLYKKKIAFLKKNTSKKTFEKVQLLHTYLQTEPWQFIAFLLSIAGFLFTLYLVFIMAFILKAWCLFCIISATSSTSLFAIHGLLRYIYTR
jgi:uncharacterized membrane protein